MLNDSRYDPSSLHLVQQQIADGNQAAFARLYSFYKQRLVSFSFSLVRVKEIAEEVVEDVFIKLWQNRASLVTIENIAVYLYVAVKNTSLNRLSHKARQMVTQPYDDIDSSIETVNADPFQLLITADMMKAINLAIENLPPRCKMIFKLVREDNLKYKEISQILNISVNTIDAQMAIAVKRLCEALDIRKHANQHKTFTTSKNTKKI